MNKNAIPFDTNPPMKPSGIRIGSPALTTRGMKENEMRQVGKWISEALHNRTDKTVLARDQARRAGIGGSVSAVCVAESEACRDGEGVRQFIHR